MSDKVELDSLFLSPLNLDSHFDFEVDSVQPQRGEAACSLFAGDYELEPAISEWTDSSLDPSSFSIPTTYPQSGYVAPLQLENNQQTANSGNAFVPMWQPQDSHTPAEQFSLSASHPVSTHITNQSPLPQPRSTPRYVDQSVADQVYQQTMARLDNVGAELPLSYNTDRPPQTPNVHLSPSAFNGMGDMPQLQAAALPAKQAPPRSTSRRQRMSSSSRPMSKRAKLQKEQDELLVGIDESLLRKQLVEGHGTQHYAKMNLEEIPTRVLRRVAFASKQIYPRLLPSPDWSGFKYTACGELEPGTYFTRELLNVYLLHHPLHFDLNGICNAKTSGLRLWLQRNPADSLQRYGDKASSRCRLLNCCAHLNLIGQAAYRVCFDERHRLADYDPMHNAGYVHLYCLEKFFDVPALFWALNVAVDDRELEKEPLGRNRMRFSSTAEENVAREFIRKCESKEIKDSAYPHKPQGYDGPFTYGEPWDYEGSLVHMLALKKVEMEPAKQKNDRNQRGSRAAFDKHLGNLEIESKERYISRRTGRGGNTVESIKRNMKHLRIEPYPRTYTYDSEDDDEVLLKPRPRARRCVQEENDEDEEEGLDYPEDNDDESLRDGESEEEDMPRPTRKGRNRR